MTPEHDARWREWQAANVVSAQRGSLHARVGGAVLLGAMFIWMLIALLP